MRIVIATFALILAATAAEAGVPDNLQCYELSNANLRGLRGLVDLDTPSFGLAPGCRVSRAKLYCVPATAEVQPGTLADGGTPLDEVLYQGRPAETDRVCYRVQCPQSVGNAPDQTVTDRFGVHHFKSLRTEMMCAPATGGTLPPPRGGFRIDFPEIDIDPGQDVSYCYYFRTPNAETLPVARFSSEMGPYMQQMITFTTTNGSQGYPMERLPPGIVSAADCSPLPTGQVVPNWIYEAHEPTNALAFPSDDGTGKPVALEIPPLSSGFILLHAVNTGTEVVKTKAALAVEPLASPVYTKTDTYTAYSSQLAIPPLSNGVVETRACATPPNSEFWWLSTLAHKRADRTDVFDGRDPVLTSLDWSHPASETLATPPFRSFASGKLTYACTYHNAENRTVHRGNSYQTDEECLAVGYFFPADRPYRCSDGIGPY
jgi:hypothetical protein